MSETSVLENEMSEDKDLETEELSEVQESNPPDTGTKTATENSSISDADIEKVDEAAGEDPYAYLTRDFSSENFKIELKNLPKFYGMHEIRKLLNQKLKLGAVKIKSVKRNSPFVFACFRSDQDRDKAIEVLSNYEWKKHQLHATKAKPSPDPLVNKRKQASEENVPNKRAKVDDVPDEDRVKYASIPSWNVEYKEQLRLKQEAMQGFLRRLANGLTHANPELTSYFSKQRKLHGGLPCELSEIRFSEEIEGYRNKCEFTIGYDKDNQPTVGFRLGTYSSGSTTLGRVDDLVHIPQPMKVVVRIFEEFVKSSDLKVYDPELQTGHFRQLTVRSAPDQLMLIVAIHPQDLSEEELAGFKNSLVDYFSNGAGKGAGVTSLFFQKMMKKHPNVQEKLPEHLWGETHIYYKILDLTFRISPLAFFQVNTAATEILYKSAMELAEPMDKSTVLDVCSGAGTVGLCFAKKCSQVLGVESFDSAVQDAKRNATFNLISNADFSKGKAEDQLGNICLRAKSSEIIAVLDPPRAGLAVNAIRQIRKIEKIRKVIYISCNANAAYNNFISLGQRNSKKFIGEALVPTRAIAVDMFPYTKHCELVLCFERYDAIKI